MEVPRLNQGTHPTCVAHALAMCIHLHLLHTYSAKFAPTAAHIRDRILSHVGYMPSSIDEMYQKIKSQICPTVWFEAGDHLIRIDIGKKALPTFDSMRPYVSPQCPVICRAKMPGCYHVLVVHEMDDKNAKAINSWGKFSDPVVQITQGGPVSYSSMPFDCAVLLHARITEMQLDSENVPPPEYVAGYNATAKNSFFVKKEPVDVPCQAPAVPQRVKKGFKFRPRGTKVPWGERVARQVVVTTSTKDKFDRRMALGLKRWINIWEKWRPGQKSEEMKSNEELSQCVAKFVNVNRRHMQAAHLKMKVQWKKTQLLREEKRTRQSLSRMVARRLPLMANEFDELPPLPENTTSDTESEAHSVHTLEYIHGEDEQDLSNC